MKKKIITLASFLLFISSCSYKLENLEAPIDLIPQDSFTLVLYDIMILEAYFDASNRDQLIDNIELIKATEPIFEKHKIDSARFTSSMDYYSHHQELLSEIYNSIQDSLTLKTISY